MRKTRRHLPGAHALSGALVAVVLMLSACATPTSTHADIAGPIQARYEAELFTLGFSKQRHYAQRLYRISGDEAYLPANLAYASRLAVSLRRDIEGLERPGYAMARSRAMVDAYPTRTAKQRRRKPMLAGSGEIPFAKNLLFRLVQARDYRLLDTPPFAGHEKALAYLETVDFRAFLLDPAVNAIYAAQTANIVHYLEDLGITDLRREYIAAFRDLYPPQRDTTLTNAEFRNKIYGLTHLVIAASDYYQHPVSATEFAWVLDYFAANIERIIDETKADIYTEVGIAFLLAGRPEHPAVERVKAALRGAYDPEARMIPSESGGTELGYGEHRNVLAIMLFRWPDRLYPGPDLSHRSPFLFHQIEHAPERGVSAMAQPLEDHHLAGHQ